MGNLCGKESSPDPFAQPGRTLSSAPPSSKTRTVPVPTTVSGPSRPRESRTTAAEGDAGDARRKAAEAAETRARSVSKNKGKLANALQEQKKQTWTSTLEGMSKQELRAREIDEMARAQAYN
ncbi:hypothetical protein K3495_g8187 [Podosphaera aphanis]|nr:hypothetical protein K3495_g8187 [Podosphaera aphanis]